MKLLGITGGIGAGKSFVTGMFQRLGATVVDADAISRQVMTQSGIAYPQVVSAFGEEILLPNRDIDRKKLASIIFSDELQRERLNQITHAAIFQEMERQIQSAKTDLVCLDVPLLFDSDFPFSCDKTLAVLAPKELRISRVMERDGSSREEVEQRIAAQLSDKAFAEQADFHIYNTGSEQELKQAVEQLYHKIME